MSPLLTDALRALRRPGATGWPPPRWPWHWRRHCWWPGSRRPWPAPTPAFPRPSASCRSTSKATRPASPRPGSRPAGVLWAGAAAHGVPLQHIARVSEESLILRSRSGAPQQRHAAGGRPGAAATLRHARAAGRPHGHAGAARCRGHHHAARAAAVGRGCPRRCWAAACRCWTAGPGGGRRACRARPAQPALPMMELLAGYDSLANSRTPEQREWPFMINGRVFARLMPGPRPSRSAPGCAAAMAHPWPSRSCRRVDQGAAAFFRGLPLLELPFAGEATELRWQRVQALGAAAALVAAARRHQRHSTCAPPSCCAARLRPRCAAAWAHSGATCCCCGRPRRSARAAGGRRGGVLLSWWLAPWLAQWLGVWLPELPPWPCSPPQSALSVDSACCSAAAGAARAAPGPGACIAGRTAGEGPGVRRLRQVCWSLQLLAARCCWWP